MEYPAAFPNGLVNPSNYNLASSSVNNVNIDSDISKIQLPNEIENSSGSDTTNINKDNTNRIQESQRYQPNNQNKLVNSSISALSIETKQPNAIGMADSHNSIHSNSNNAFPMNNLNSNMSNNNNSNQMNPMSMNPNLPMNLGSIASYANLTSHHAMNFAGFGNTYSPYMRSIGSDPGMAYQSVSLQRPDQNNTNNTQGAKRKYDQLQQETGQGESYGSSDEDDDDDDEDGSKGKKSGRRKIKIEYIVLEEKSRRQITFSKRKAGIMKKAFELSTLTGTQALLLIASETGHVYTFATSKLQPFVNNQEGKTLIQNCLSADYPPPSDTSLLQPTIANYTNKSRKFSNTEFLPSLNGNNMMDIKQNYHSQGYGSYPPKNTMNSSGGMIPQQGYYSQQYKIPATAMMNNGMNPNMHMNMYSPPHLFDRNDQMKGNPVTETKLIVLVGKMIMVSPPQENNYQNLLDLKYIPRHVHQIIQQVDRHSLVSKKDITCLAGGFQSYFFEYNYFSQDLDLSTTDVVVGLKVAEVDYTNQVQQSFSFETLTQFLEEGKNSIDPEIWKEIDNKPYITKSNLDSQPYNVFVVSTHSKSFVNVVFGVRKISEKGHQVVGISCKPPGRHVIQLDIDDFEHKHLLSLIQGMEGQPLYHLLPVVQSKEGFQYVHHVIVGAVRIRPSSLLSDSEAILSVACFAHKPDHEEVYSWFTGPQPEEWNGPKDKFYVLSHGGDNHKKRKLDTAEAVANKKHKVDHHKEERLEESEDLCVVSKYFSISKEKVYRAFNCITKTAGYVTLSRLFTFLKRDQTSYGKLKEKLHAWIKRYHIFDSVREKSNAFRLDMPKNRTEKETEVSESALRYPTNSSSQSEIQEDSTTNSSDQSDNSEVESSESEEVRKKKKNRAKIAKKKHVKESKDVPIYDTSSDDIVDCGLSESEERIEDIFS